MNKVTKEEAARRQLDTAIEIFFSEGDLLVAYGITSAAFMVTENLYLRMKKNEGKIENYDAEKATFLSILENKLSNEDFKQLKLMLGKIPNFLKHANQENDEEITDVNLKQVLGFVCIAAQNFQRVFGYYSVPMQMLVGYFVTQVEDPRIESLFDEVTITQLKRQKELSPDFLREAALARIYEAKGVDIRQTVIGRIILNP